MSSLHAAFLKVALLKFALLILALGIELNGPSLKRVEPFYLYSEVSLFTDFSSRGGSSFARFKRDLPL